MRPIKAAISRLSKSLPWGMGVGLLLACSSIDCPVQNTVTVNYGLYRMDGTELVNDTLADTLYVWTPRADGKDTLIMNRGVNLHAFSLPISYQHPEDTLVFLRANTEGMWTLDTVWLKKDDIPHFESVDCPTHFFHRLTAVRCTHRGLDSITIANPSVTYDSSPTHLRLYFK